MSSLLARAKADIEISRILLTDQGNPTRDEMITHQSHYAERIREEYKL